MFAFIIIPLVLFSLVRYFDLERYYLDAYLLAALLYYSYNKTSFLRFFAVVFVVTFIQFLWNPNVLVMLNFAILPLAILNRTDPVISKFQFRKYFPIVVLYVFTKTIVDLILGQFVEGGDRIAGPFTSSLHLAYFCVVSSCVIVNLKCEYARVLVGMLFISTVISGSRIGAIGTFLIMLLQYPNSIRFILISFVAVIAATALSQSIRVVTYIPEAEDIRIQGFINFFDWIKQSNLSEIIFGTGRMSYGAMGYRLYGDSVFITESSLIMLLFCYGVFGLYFYWYFIQSIYKVSRYTKNWQALFIPVLFTVVSPFIDSSAILTMNMALISSCIGTKRSGNY